MTMTMPLTLREANAKLLRSDFPATIGNLDLVTVSAFSAFGLLLTIGFEVFFPHAAVAAALAWTVI